MTVTGGAGYLGEHVVKLLLGVGWRVRVLDAARRPTWTEGLDVEYLQGDIRDPDTVTRAVRGASSVVHTAFASPQAPPTTMRDVNVQGTTNVRLAAARESVEGLVVVSSTIVTRATRRHPFLRRSPIDRLDAYRSSRIAAEEAARSSTGSPSVAVVRPKTFIGPGRVAGFALLFGLVREGARIPLLGPGRNRYQLLDVRDLADAIVTLSARPAAGLFELGASQFGTVAEDLAALIDHANTDSRVRHVPKPLARAALRTIELAGLTPLSEWHHCVAREVDSVVDIGRARHELGWEPLWSNVASMAAAYDWFTTELDTQGAVATTHPIPRSHRALRRAATALMR